MNALRVFVDPEFGEIRTVEVNGEPWLVGKDVARALGYQNPQRAIRDHVDDEDKGVTEMVTPGGKQSISIINESGLYSLILSSKLPGAKRFKRWVTSEVLPSIRRTGGYGQYVPADLLNQLVANTQVLTQSVQALAQEVASIKAVQQMRASAPSALGEAPMAEAGFMDSREVARILGRPHNNVLKGIRATVERARLRGVPVDKHFIICYRTHWNNVRCPYYRMDETAISMFSRAMKNLTLAEKLRSAFKEKEKHI